LRPGTVLTPGTVVRRVVCWSLIALVLGWVLSSTASGEELLLFGAGSLREVMTQIATDYQARYGGTVRTEFGPSGLMRERIERGERVDLFASADMGGVPR
jgi:molybdate transport system substrate-binding protein